MENIFDSWLVNTYIAHRGLHNEQAPENSLLAFKNAMNKGYAIEFDVRQLSDGTVVVFHDATICRMTSGDKYVQSLTKEDLAKYNLLDSNEHIPTLEEALELINGQVPILIEIKNEGNVGDLEKNTLRILNNYSGEFAIQSFNPYTIKWFKDNAPHITRGILSSYFKKENLSFIKKFALKRMLLNKSCCPEFIAYDYKSVPNRYVKKYSKLPLLCWAVPSQTEYEKVVKYCDNIIFENFDPKI